MVHLLDVSTRPMQIATDKLHLVDPLRAAVSGSKIGDITVCNELAPALGNARVLSMDLNQSNFHNLDKLPKKPKGKQHWYQVMLWACQHELSIHVVKTGDGSIYARVFQCYYGANTYSAKEWLQKQRWMNFAEYVHFLSQLREIRRKTKKFVRDNLLPSLALPPNMSPVHKRKAADWGRPGHDSWGAVCGHRVLPIVSHWTLARPHEPPPEGVSRYVRRLSTCGAAIPFAGNKWFGTRLLLAGASCTVERNQ